jgi:hypothetical protein
MRHLSSFLHYDAIAEKFPTFPQGGGSRVLLFWRDDRRATGWLRRLRQPQKDFDFAEFLYPERHPTF